MPSEIELKYAPPVGFSADALFSLPEIAPFCGKVSEIEMKTEYLDTPDFAAAKCGITLRRRFENGESVIYAKCRRHSSNEFSVRGEWRVVSRDISNAARLCEAAGAPTDVLSGVALVVVGRVSFLRKEALVTLPDELSFLLSFDEGFFGEEVPFSEIELELQSGDADELLRFGRELSKKYFFSPETRSKYARSLI